MNIDIKIRRKILFFIFEIFYFVSKVLVKIICYRVYFRNNLNLFYCVMEIGVYVVVNIF